MKPTSCSLVMLVLLAAAAGCGSDRAAFATADVGIPPAAATDLRPYADSDERDAPQLSVAIEGRVNPDRFPIPVVRSGQTETFEVEISNTGSAPLEVSRVGLEPDGNPYVSLSWSESAPELPRTFAPGDELDYLRFRIVYTPQAPPSFESAALIVESDDPERAHYRLPIEVLARAPRIRVFPPSYTFQNATPAVPETQQFTITNEGNEKLVVHQVSFDRPSSEFRLVDRPGPKAEIEADDTAPDDKLVFTVRYQPMDDEIDDRVAVEVRSNDPTHPILAIDLKTRLLAGKLVVTHEDMLKGYVDFQSLVNAGEQETKTINLLNEGPGPLRVVSMDLEPKEAESAYEILVRESGEEPVPYTTDSAWGVESQASLDVLVRYSAPDPDGVDARLSILYGAPYESAVDVPLMGGKAKPRLAVYPSSQSSTSALQYHADGAPKTRTLVLANEGTAPVKVHAIRLERPPAFESQPEEFEITSEPALPLDLAGLSLLPVEVRYKAETDGHVAASNLVVAYIDAAGSDALWKVRLTGYNEPGAGVLLPVADPGTPADYAGALTGSVAQLDGTGSAPGDAPIAGWGGYFWYLASKPPQSAVSLNRLTVSRTSFIPDKAGDYRVILFVETDFLTTGAGTKHCGGSGDCYFNLWADQAEVVVHVLPGSPPDLRPQD
jgi:hypothetical protein